MKESKPIVTEIRWFENRNRSKLIAFVGFFRIIRILIEGSYWFYHQPHFLQQLSGLGLKH